MIAANGSKSNNHSNWRRVTAHSPCPVCKSTGWCSVSADGTLATCMRVADGAWRSKQGKDGQTYHLHRLNGDA
jgi:hypothetical protein